MKCKNEKLFALFLSVLLSACSVNQSLNLPNDKKLSNVNKLNTFKTKVEGNIMNFSGTWTTDNNGAFYSIDENVTLNGSWEVKNENPNDNLNTANSNFYESSSSVLYHNTNQVSYLGNGWLNTTFPNTSMQTYYSYNAGNPVSIPYYNTSLAQIKFYNSIYPQGTVYSTSMSGWTFTGSLNSSITTSEIGSKIEIIPNQEFTNFHIVHRKGPNRGSFKVSIYSNLDTLEKEFILNGYNTTNSLSKQEIYGLPKGMHKIVIENLGGTNGNIMDFVDIKIYPSIVASVNGTNFDWYAYVGPNYGKAYLSIDGQGYGYIDLYDANSTIKKVYSIDTLSNQEHTVTIDLTGYKSTSSSGFRVSFATIGNENSVSGSFEGNKIAFNFIKGPDAGILDVFIDNNFVKQINLYSPTKEYYSDLITGLSSGNHTFKISSKREKDLLARGNKIMIDGISEESKLDYSFNGIGIRFKNNLLDNSGMFYIDPINYSYDIFFSI
ncbi:MAG: hypothetical protein KatS3mg068_0428 [Candidatus Sericytochromatia bacterium]|nr:MAG: hypothetical protein KatS3mg068_0428 [Candidatus Sericytochromatia bacterium]